MDESQGWMAEFFGGGDEAEEAFERLVGRWKGQLYAGFLRWGARAEDAEDLTQETLLRVYLNRDREPCHRYKPDRPFRPWVRQIAYHVWLDHMARRRATPLPDEWEPEAPGNDPAVSAQQHEQVRKVLAACARLSGQEQAFLYLWEFGLGALREDEVAEVLQLGTNLEPVYRQRLAEMTGSDDPAEALGRLQQTEIARVLGVGNARTTQIKERAFRKLEALLAD